MFRLFRPGDFGVFIVAGCCEGTAAACGSQEEAGGREQGARGKGWYGDCTPPQLSDHRRVRYTM
ncbi:MAG: hypothetical protein QNJ36_04495 [Calothrix sp. MO_167.B42]|nr:hypothetical protein [Calothrix sp. MO_167.B42]